MEILLSIDQTMTSSKNLAVWMRSEVKQIQDAHKQDEHNKSVRPEVTSNPHVYLIPEEDYYYYERTSRKLQY